MLAQHATSKMKAGLSWMPHEDNRLLELKAACKAAAVIAKILNRTEAAVLGRISTLNRSRNALRLIRLNRRVRSLPR
jgi:hypothetical protein